MPITANRGVVVDDSALKAHLRDFAKVMGRSLSDVIRDQAAAFCLDMIKITRPSLSKDGGMEKPAKDKGVKNVRDAVFHIFRPLDLATSEQVAAIGRYDVFKMWEKRQGGAGDKGKARKMRWTRFREAFGGGKALSFIEAGDLSAIGSVHDGLRDDNGRGPLFGYAKKSKSPFAIVAKEKDLETYARQKARDVGTLKSAYYHAAVRIKGKIKAAAWVKLPAGQLLAIGEDHTNTDLVPLVIIGNLKGRKGVTDSLVQAALNHRAFAMRNAMAYELNKRKESLWSASSGSLSNTYQYFS